jgi:hypothetical protein
MKISDIYPSKFLKVADLQTKPLEAVIREVRIEQVGMDGDEKPVLYFRNKTKGFVLNKTNALAICARYGDVLDDWAGRPIILYPARTPFQGKVVDAQKMIGAGGGADGDVLVPFSEIVEAEIQKLGRIRAGEENHEQLIGTAGIGVRERAAHEDEREEYRRRLRSKRLRLEPAGQVGSKGGTATQPSTSEPTDLARIAQAACARSVGQSLGPMTGSGSTASSRWRRQP